MTDYSVRAGTLSMRHFQSWWRWAGAIILWCW